MNGTAKIRRFHPETDEKPYFQEYKFRMEPGMSALDVLNQIFAKQDATLGYSYCCKTKICGMCGAVINKKPALLCIAPAEPGMTIEPLENFPVKKDLIIDRDFYERRRPAIRMFPERSALPISEPESIEPGNI